MRSDGEGKRGAGTDGEGRVWWGADEGQGVLGLGDVAVHAWQGWDLVHWHPVVITCCLLFPCFLLFTCCLPVVCCLLFVCRFLIACHFVGHLSLCVACLHMLLLSHIVVQCCQWVVVLGACGCSCCWALVAICGWWCGHGVVSWFGGVIVIIHGVAHSPYMAWALGLFAIWCAPSSSANKVSEVGGNDDGWLLTLPSALPHTWHGHSTCSLPCLHLCPLH